MAWTTLHLNKWSVYFKNFIYFLKNILSICKFYKRWLHKHVHFRTRAHVRVYFLSIYISPSYMFDFFFRSFEVEWGLRKGRIVEILPAGILTIAFYFFLFFGVLYFTWNMVSKQFFLAFWIYWYFDKIAGGGYQFILDFNQR